ncbi:C-factor-like [Dreissena polymorpha]|uniref:C-factor n=1 Tax=Dreissena polymorpha TaxID=45954 RepID=A0A9D3YT00_DREPO|nr:C-factor-like [Dreissena polymorpha]KAH3706498.1 hypothetical protein DPMN_065885 [Dreissena polymorpha]
MTAPLVTLVQGSSRGIGLQFCKALLLRKPNTVVIATCRSPEGAMDLEALRSQDPHRLHVLKIDVTQESHIEAAANYVGDKFGRLDLLINCSGMLHPSGRGETSLKDVTMQGLAETCATNAFGPLLMGKHFGKLLQKGTGAGHQSPDVKLQHAGVLANISAKTGSITANDLGGWHSYRLAKAALNMATRNLAIELGRGKNRVICISLHPGNVDTQLSRPYHKNMKDLMSTEQCVDKLMNVMDGLNIEDSGKFYNYEKVLLPF